MYAEIAIMRNHANIDHLFTYLVPDAFEKCVKPGVRVMVPFGVSGVLEGIIIRLKERAPESEDFEIKPIAFAFDDGIFLTQEMLDTAEFIRTAYLCSYAEALTLFLPAGTLTRAVRFYSRTETELKDGTPSEKRALSLFGERAESELDLIERGVQKRTLNRLTAIGCLKDTVQYEAIIENRYQEWVMTSDALESEAQRIPEAHKAKKRLALTMLRIRQCERTALQKQLKIPKSVIDGLIKSGALKLEKREVQRLPAYMSAERRQTSVTLNADQQRTLDTLWQAYANRSQSRFLIHGVTGSGKTEIYAELIEKMIALGKTTLLLVPEIALTPQIVARFVARFGRERIALLHSKISLGERYDQWQGIAAGKYDIVIGARSAVFAPVSHLGLIILDESHDASYRSEKRPKYNTYEIAEFRAEQHGALLVSGTATPGISEYYASEVGKVKRLSLTGRYNAKKVPRPEIIDMRDELAEGNRSILSRRLYDAIEERLQLGEQSIIFLNRKGHSTFVSCRSCGFALACPNCDVTLTYFKGSHEVVCNYCGYKTFVPKKCPKCGSAYFKYFGVGTEKVEEEIRHLFPQANVARMDRTTTTKKGSVERIIEAVESEKVDILIGTQMVTKGFDFKKVTLVGILSADLILNLPNYLASERAYQLFNQVSGRAGRGDREGEVILQTYTPEHFALRLQDYEAFYKTELQFRKEMHYPPFFKLVNLIFTSKEEAEAHRYAEMSHNYLKSRIFKKGLQNYIEIYDANPALLKKIDGQFRWQVLLKCRPDQMEKLKKWLKGLSDRFSTIQECQLSMDLDATNVL